MESKNSEESAEDHSVDPELYFLIAKFLSGGPLKETAKTLVKELDSAEVLPRRLDWEGTEHAQTYDELCGQYGDMSWRRLATACRRLLSLAGGGAPRLPPRLSLLGPTVVRGPPAPRPAPALPQLVAGRETWGRPERPLPRRLLAGLQLQRRTLGHLSAVYCLVFDPTGRYVITGADDLLVKVWSAIDGRLLATLRGAAAEITDASVSHDGALLAVGSVERLVRVWCLATGAPRAVLHAHQGTITSVQWAPPAREVRWLASTSTDGSVAFWTCSTDGQFLSQPVQYVERMRPGACHMICAAWSAGGAFLAAGSADQHVRVYAVHDAPAPRRILETPAHSDAVDSIAWAHRALRFVTGSKDGTAALWQLHATQWRHTTLVPEPVAATAGSKGDNKNNKLKVTMVCWDRSDALVFTAVSDYTVRVWCARTARPVRVMRGHRDEAYVLEPHPTLPAVVLSAGHDGQLLVWDATTGETIARFTNHIDGQGEGAIFDAKWGGDATVAASDSHGHLLLLGLGAGHPRLGSLPLELFFHTDYRPLARDALGGALDEQTETPPHLLAPPFLVDVEGAPHVPALQRLVPGREALPHALLAPLAPPQPPALQPPSAPGVWRGEGVRHTPDDWLADAVPPSTRAIVPPLCPAARARLERAAQDVNRQEQSAYRREMRRRPLMISTATEGGGPPRRRNVRKPAQPRPPPAPRPPRPPSSEEESSSSIHSSQHSDLDLSSSSSSSGSQYSDWEAGTALAPPLRARRRPAPARRYTPPAPAPRRAPAPSPSAPRSPSPSPPRPLTPEELPEAFRVGEWITAVTPRKAPYHPQMGDQCLYFRIGHQRYFEAVAEKDLYKVNPRDKPWERTMIYECEPVKVIGIKYVIKPPRVVCLRLASSLGGRNRSFTVRYHDMPDVIDFLVLKQQVDAGVGRRWSAGDRFRCIIDDQWWSGCVVDRPSPDPPPAALSAPARWAAAAAAHFLSVRVRWDNGELERLSPWDLEPAAEGRAPPAPGAALPVLPHELRACLYQPEPGDWQGGTCEEANGKLAELVGQVMSLAAAEPFVAPVDLQRYPSYAKIIPYPIDLATIKARFDNLFYRRAAHAQWDVRHVAGNAERYNEAHSRIVRHARLITDLLLRLISRWRQADVVLEYKALAADYRSEDEEATAARQATTRRDEWTKAATDILDELWSSPDSEPFRRPVSPTSVPDYRAVVRSPLDLGTVRARLEAGRYTSPDHVAQAVRRVFANSRLYNTNKRSRIYSMTVRLSALFEALWSRMARLPRRRHAAAKVRQNGYLSGGSSSSEPLAVTSRRRHGGHGHDTSRHGVTSRDRARDDDSWDSDMPLHNHRKGKGVGKKSKSRSVASTEPLPSTSTSLQPDHHTDEEYVPETNGVCSDVEGRAGSSSSHYTNIEVLEEELDDTDVEIAYDSDRQTSRVRKRGRSSGSSEYRAPPHLHRHKRTRRRERVSLGSSSSSSPDDGAGPDGGAGRVDPARYESDHSYRPRYSTDDDAPLNVYRQRTEEVDIAQPGPSGVSTNSRPTHSRPTNGHTRRVARLRRRVSRRYNEDSESDSALAISKRRPPTSVSQRGRVRTLTHKARDLTHLP